MLDDMVDIGVCSGFLFLVGELDFLVFINYGFRCMYVVGLLMLMFQFIVFVFDFCQLFFVGVDDVVDVKFIISSSVNNKFMYIVILVRSFLFVVFNVIVDQFGVVVCLCWLDELWMGSIFL